LPPDDRAWHRSIALHPGTVRRRFVQLAGPATSLATLGASPDGGAEERDPRQPSGSGAVEWRLRLPEPLADDLVEAIERRRIEVSAAVAATAATAHDGAQMFSVGRGAGAPRSAKQALRLAARGQFEPDFGLGSSAIPIRFPFTVGVAHTLAGHGRPMPAWVGLMALLEDYVSTWDAAEPRRADTRGAIYGRSGFRCAAPLCTSRSKLELHHLLYRSHGGGDGAENLELACCFHHHRGEHGLLASCTGRAPLGVIWRLGREDLAEWWCNERRLVME
jgi:hypothetical protein